MNGRLASWHRGPGLRPARRATRACVVVLCWLCALSVRAQTPPASSREPSVGEVVKMAMRAARSLDPERIRALARRARLAGLMPVLRVSGERGFDQDLQESTSVSSGTTREAIGDDLSFGATLTFELDRLVFAPEEVRLLSVERWLATDRRKLVGEVVRLYFQRRRLLREQKNARAPDPELADSIHEVEALLDALTAGEFAKALAKARK